MRLTKRTISKLAEMICGASGNGLQSYEWKNFPYRSSSELTRFFRNCDLDYIHKGETRDFWVENVLDELNLGTTSSQQLPSISLIRVLEEIIDPVDYARKNLDEKKALLDLNNVLSRDGIEVYFDINNRCLVRTMDKLITSGAVNNPTRPLSPEEIQERRKLVDFLKKSSEEDIINQLLVPLFRQLGFTRVTPTGHVDKALEFGRDIWMKFRLPTGHFIYFVAQVKKGKIDSSGKSNNNNISAIVNQARMALDYPVLDPETNRKHLVDHIFIISADTITKQARNYLIEILDKEARRHIIFMDRDEILDLGAITDISTFISFDTGNTNSPF